MGIGVGGPRWKEQRRFASKSLKDLSEGQKGMENKIMKEVAFTIQHIRQSHYREVARWDISLKNILDLAWFLSGWQY